MAFMSPAEVKMLGFLEVGDNVLISDKCSIYGANRISIGNNSRIDDFCLLSMGEHAKLIIGKNVHIGSHTSVVGSANVTICDFVGISTKVSIFSTSEDFYGGSMTNPTVPDKYKNPKHAPISIGKHALVGASSVLLPGSILLEGTAVGALSNVTQELEAWFIYSGNPLKKFIRRSKKLLEFEAAFHAENK